MVRAPVARGVVNRMVEFVLICPLGKPSGEISWIPLQMFPCVCMLRTGVGPFDLNENVPQRFAAQASPSSAHRKSSHLRIFPGSPAESTFCDQRHWNTTTCRLDPSLSWHSLQPFGISSGNTESVPAVADHQSQHSFSCKVHFHFNSVPSSV